MKTWFLFLLTFTSLSSASTVDSLLNSLSLEEKIGQMIIVYHSPLSFLKKYNIGGTLVMRNMISNEEKFTKSLSKMQDSLKIPLLVSIDQEGGTVNRLSKKAQWKNAPSAEVISDWSFQKSFDYHHNIAEKLNELGINLNLAPVLDPQYDCHDSATYMKEKKRAFALGYDDALLGFTSAFTEHNIGTTAKHFPGYDALVNSDYHIATSDADSAFLETILEPFKEFSDQYQFIMMSSILYENISSEPAVFSKTMVNLAKDIAPNMVVMTDDLWGAAVRSYVYDGPNMSTKTYPDTAFAKVVDLSFRAGNDMLMITYPQKVPLMIKTIKEIAERDPSYRKAIDISVRNILIQKQKLQLF